MNARLVVAACGAAVWLATVAPSSQAPACCPASRPGQLVLNADQTVVILWDAATQTQHFIRRASFRGDAKDFGFLIPTPSRPELAESGDQAFSRLAKLTAPRVIRRPRPAATNSGLGCGCGHRVRSAPTVGAAAPPPVMVLDRQVVAGFDAVVLEASSADGLVAWLKEHGYSYSPEIEAWARPYVERGWKITALKVAAPSAPAVASASPEGTDAVEAVPPRPASTVATAKSLRLSFNTDRPLFPYREPEYKDATATRDAKRLLRIFFIADARYDGALTAADSPEPVGSWTGKVAWSNKIDAEQRRQLRVQLGLPLDASPAEWVLTEFEDRWPYKLARGDLYFSKTKQQTTVERPPVYAWSPKRDATDATVYAIVAAVLAPTLWSRWRRKRSAA